MARPKKENKMIPFTIMLDPDIVQEIKDMAEKADLPAANLARNLVLTGLDDARIFDKLGILRMFSGGKKQIKKILDQFNFEGMDIFKE